MAVFSGTTTVQDRMTYRVNEVLALTGISRSTLYRLVARGELALVKVCGRTLIARTDLDAMLARMRVVTATPRAGGHRRSPRAGA